MLIAGFVLDGNLPLAVPLCTTIFIDLREIFEKYFVYIKTLNVYFNAAYELSVAG